MMESSALARAAPLSIRRASRSSDASDEASPHFPPALRDLSGGVPGASQRRAVGRRREPGQDSAGRQGGATPLPGELPKLAVAAPAGDRGPALSRRDRGGAGHG